MRETITYRSNAAIRRLLLPTLFLFISAGSVLSQVIWQENFSGANQGWSTNITDCDGAAGSFAGVRNNRFELQGMEGAPCCTNAAGVQNGNGGNFNEWVTNPINISGYCRISISAQYGSTGNNPFECSPGGPWTGVDCSNGQFNNGITQSHDQIVFEYSLDGGPWIQFGYVCGAGNGTMTVNNLVGSTVAIRIMPANKSEGEIYWFDNVTVQAPTPPTVNQPANRVVCAGAGVSVNFTGSAGATFNWTNDNTAIGLGASGTGNINFTTPAGLSMQEVATITVTPVSANCPGTPVTFTITVNPRPMADDPPNQVVCAGEPVAASLTGTAGATLNWTNSNPAIGLGASGSGDIMFTSANVASVQVGTITVTPTANGCPGTPQTFTVTVNPSPVLPAIAPVTRCAGQAVNVSFGGPAGTTYAWTNDNPNIGLAGSGTGNINFTGQAPNGTQEVANITVTPTLGNCVGQPQNLTITVNPVPQVDPPSNLTVCGGDPISVSFSGTSAGASYNWLNNNPSTGIPATGSGDISATAANVSGTSVSNITVTPVENGCSGTPRSFTVTVNATPSVNPPNNVTRCVGQAVNINFSGTGGGVYNWVNDNPSVGLGASGTGNINFTGQAPNGGPETANITVTPVNGNCIGQPQMVTVTINPAPLLDPVPNLTVCGGEPINVGFTVSSPTATINWTNTNTQTGISGSGSGDINTSAANVTGVQISNITATPTENGCPGTPRTFAVTVQPTPVLNQVAPVVRCAGQNVSVTVSGTAGATLTWTNDNTAIGLGASGNGGSFNFTGQTPSGVSETGNITVTPVFGNCPGQPMTFSVTINPTPQMDPPPSLTVCAEEAINVSFTGNSPGITYNWTNNNPGTGIPGTGSGDISVTAANVPSTRTSNITVTPVENGCSGTPRTLSVTVLPKPIVNPIVDITRCVGQPVSVTFSGNGPGGVYNWTNDNPAIGLGASGVGNINFNGQAPNGGPETATITVTPVNGICVGQPQTFTITVNPVPTLAPIPNLTVCGGEPIDVMFNGSTSGTIINWTNNNNTTGIPSSGSGDINVTSALVNSVRISTIVATPSEFGCNGAPQTLAVTVQPTPVINPISDLSRCAGQAVSVTISGTGGAVFNWSNDNPAIGLPAVGTGSALNFTGTAPNGVSETGTITVVPRFANCVGEPVTFNITINPVPTVAPVPNLTVCAGDPINVAFTGNSPTATFNWTNNNPGTGIPFGGSGDINEVAAPVTSVRVSNITVTPVEFGCSGTPRNFSVTVQPLPIVNLVNDVTRCAGQSITVNFAGTAGTTYNWVNDNTEVGLPASGSGNITFTGKAPSGILEIATVTVTPVNGNCVGEARSFQIAINPLPILDPIPNLTVCGGDPIIVNFSGSSPTLTYNWTNANTATGIPGSGSGPINQTAANSTTVKTSNISVTAVEGGCNSLLKTFSVTVQPTPAVEPIPAVAKCVGEQVSVTFTSLTAGATYTWTNSNTAIGLNASGNGAALNFTARNTTTTAQSATITVTPRLGTCVGAPLSFEIIIHPLPLANAVPNVTVCGGDPISVNFSGSSPNVTYNWSNTNTSTGIAASGTGNLSATTTPSQTVQVGTISVTPVENGCNGTPVNFTATVQPIPVINALPALTKCAGEAIAVTFNGTNGTQYAWTNNNTNIGLGASGNGANLNFTGTATGGSQVATISVNPTLGTCVGAPTTFDVIVNPLPGLNPVPNQVVCGGAPINVSFSGSSGTSTYNWSNSNTATGIAASGSGNISVNTSPSQTQQVGTVTVTPVDNGCTGPALIFTATVQPVPVVNPIPGVVKCAGEAVAVTLTGTNGTQYAWSNNNTGIGLGGSGNGSTIGFTATAGGGDQTATITVNPTLGTCAGAPQSFNVLIHVLPSLNPVPNQTVCGGEAINVTFSGSSATSTYNWSNSNTGTGIAGSGSGNISVNTTASQTQQTGTVTVTPVDNGCAGSPLSFTATVQPVPVLNPIANVTKCAGEAISVTLTAANGTQFAWTNNNTNIGLGASGNGGTIGFTGTAGGNSDQTATITVNPTLGTCAGAPQSFNVLVHPLPTVSPVPDQTVCGGASINVNFGGSSTTSTYNWTNNNSATGISASGSGNISINTSVSQTQQTGTVTVTPVDNGCTGSPLSFTTTVLPIPVLNPIAGVTQCAGIPITVPFSGTNGTQYSWTNDNTAVGLGAGGTGNSISFTGQTPGGVSQSAVVTVSPTLGTCPGTPQSFTISIGQLPTVNGVPDVVVCGNEPIAVAFNGNLPSTTYEWTNNNTATGVAVSGSGPISLNAAVVASSQTSTIVVTPNDNGCIGQPTTFKVTVNPVPVLAPITDVTRCAGLPIAVNFNAPNGTQYVWTNSNTAIGLAGGGTSGNLNFSGQVTGVDPQTAVVTVNPTLGNCPGAPQTFNITVNPVPSVNSIGNQAVCGGQPIDVTFSGNLPTTTYNWTNSNSSTGIASSGSGNISVTTPLAQTTQTGTITVTPTAFGCTGATQTFTTTVNVVPVMNPVADVSKCVGENVAVTFSGTSGTVYNWTNSNTDIGLPASGNTASFNFTTQSPTGAAQSAVITVTPSIGACPGTPQTFNINIGQQPTVNAVPDQTLCSGEQIIATFSGAIPGTTYNWVNSNAGIGVAASGTGNITQVSSPVNAPTTGTFTVTPNDNGCNGLPITFKVTVKPVPSLMDPADVKHCVGESVAVTFNGTAGAQYAWSNNNTNIGLPASGTGAAINFVSQTPGGAAQTAQITVTPSLNGCIGPDQVFNINLGQVPTVNAVPNVSLCGGQPISVAFNGILPTTVYTWTNDNTATGIAATGTGNISASSAPSQVGQTSIITVTPADNGCVGAPASFNVTVQPVPIMVKPADVTRCAGVPITVNFAGTGNAQFNWSNSNTNIGLQATGSGSLSFTGTAGNTVQTATITATPVLGACIGQPQSFNITVNPIPQLTPPTDQAVCGGDTIRVALSGTSATATYNWTNSNTAIGLAASGAGNIVIPTKAAPTAQTGTITVTPVERGCSGAPQTFTATVNPVPVMTDPADVGKCRGEVINVAFNGTAGAQYSWTNSNTNIGLPASGTSAGINFNGQITGGVSQTATITVTPSLGACPGQPQTFEIHVSPTPAVTPIPSQTLCGNEPISVVFGGSSTTTVYNWTNSNTAIGLPASGSGNISIVGAINPTNQTALVTVTPVDGGCSGSPETFNLNINAVSAVDTVPNQASCGNQPVSIPVNGSATTITWTNSNPAIGLPASGSGSIAFTATNVPQTATITLTPTGSCPGPVETFTFSIVAAPTVDNPGLKAVCSGTPLQLNFTGTPSATFAWVNNNTATGIAATGTGNINLTAPSVTQAQTSTITVTPRINGCIGTPVSFDLRVNPLPVAAITGQNRICEGQSADLTANGGSTYAWNTGASGSNVNVNPTVSTTYTVTATDANGCTDDVTFALRVNKHSAFTLLKSSCNPADTGRVTQKLVNFAGCDSILTIVTRYLDKDTTLLSRVTCVPTQAGIEQKKFVNSKGCDSLVITTVLYDPAGRDTVRLRRNSCNPAQAGITQRLLTGFDGCDSLIITTTRYVPLDTTKLTALTCNIDKVGKIVRRYDNFKGCDSLVLTTTLFTPDGRDTVRLMRNVCDPATVGTSQSLLKNKDGCDSLVIVTSILRPELCGMTSGVSIRPVSCADFKDGAASVVLTEGVPPFQYQWTAAQGLTGSGQITALNTPLQINNLPAGAFAVTISIPNTNVDTVIRMNIAGPPTLAASLKTSQATAGPYNMPCAGDRTGTLDLTTSGGTAPYQYRWSNGASIASLKDLGPGQYTVTVTDRNGCSIQLVSTLTAPPLLQLVLDIEPHDCFEPFVEGSISATGGVRPYSLLLNDKAILGAFAKFTDGVNKVALRDKNGCAVDSAFSVTVPPKPYIRLPRDTQVLLGEPITLTPRTNLIVWDTVIWKPAPDSSCIGCLSQTWFPGSSRRYDVTIVDTFGCKVSASTIVNVDRDIHIFVPNIFSPNGDGTHDVMTLGVSKYLETATLDIFRIYDRWGGQAYDWDKPIPIRQWPGWDGKFGGKKEVLPGVYVWYLKVTLANGEVIEKAGDVTVYR